MVVLEEHLGLAYHPALHLEPDQQQTAVVLGDVNGLVELEREELVPAQIASRCRSGTGIRKINHIPRVTGVSMSRAYLLRNSSKGTRVE